MAIETSKAPSQGQMSAMTYLDELMPSSGPPVGGAFRSFGIAGAPGPTSTTLSDPLPIFTVPIGKITQTDFLKSAAQTGWRYFVSGGGEDAVADVAPNGESFARLTKGEFATRLGEATAMAEAKYGAAPEVYEPRVLELPGLQLFALWLHGEQADHFVTALDGANPQTPPAFDDGFLGRAIARARAKQPAPLPAASAPVPQPPARRRPRGGAAS